MRNRRNTLWHRGELGMAVALSIGLILGGCGSDDDGGDAADTTVTAAAPAASEPADGSSSEAGEPDETGGAGDGGTTADLDVCGLLGGIDMAAVLREPVGDPELSGSKCSFDAVAADSPGAVHVMVDPDGGAEAFERQRDLLGSDGDLSGLGDEAFASGTWVHVLSGDTYFYVQVAPNPLNPDRVDVADIEALAAEIVTALG